MVFFFSSYSLEIMSFMDTVQQIKSAFYKSACIRNLNAPFYIVSHLIYILYERALTSVIDEKVETQGALFSSW